MLRKLLFTIAGGFILMIGLGMAILWIEGSSDKRAADDATLVRAGMSLDALVRAFPGHFSFASISERLRETPCKDSKGEIIAPRKLVHWPDTDEGDDEGAVLNGKANVLPFNVEAVDAFGDHLAKRNDWKNVVQIWDSVLDDDARNAVAYARRAVAQQHLGQQNEAYRDAKRACALGAQEGCELMKSFAADLRNKLESEDAETLKNAEPCLPPAASLRVLHPGESGRFSIALKDAGDITKETSRNVTPGEFAKLLSDSYPQREWVATFYYLNMTPRYSYFSVLVGKDGKVARISQTSFMD